METKTIKSLVSRFVTASKRVDRISKEIFSVITTEYTLQLASGVKNKAIKQAITKEFMEALKDDDNKIKSRLKKIVNISIAFNSYKMIEFISEDTIQKLYFNRIESIVKLVEFLQENEEATKGAFEELKGKLTITFALDPEKHSINNIIDEDVKSIKDKYNIKGEEDELEFKGTYSDLLKLIESKFSKDIEHLIDDLQALKATK